MKCKIKMLILALVFALPTSTLVWAASSETTVSPGTLDTEAETEGVPFDPFDTDDGPASDQDAAVQAVADPISGFNRVMFTFNDKLYFWLLKPVAIGYRTVLPSPVRVGVKNFFHNLLMPVRLVNCVLQGKKDAAEAEFGRFLVNSTYGVAGLFDPAKNYPGLNPPPQEDFGQTLGHYHMGNGFYIVWPVLGPSTLRDTLGTIGDWALNPLNFMQLTNVDAGVLTEQETGYALYGLRTVNDTSFHIGDYEAMKNAALDPYAAFRNAYIQNRNSKIAE